MRRINIFLAILIASLASLIALMAIGLSTFTYSSQDPYHPSNWMNGMWGNMGGMMGQTGTSGIQNPVPAYFGVMFVVLVGVTVVGVGGLAYYLAFPEIRTRPEANTAAPIVKSAVEEPVQGAVTPYASVVKTLTSEERRVIEVLAAHDGKYLQKYIRKETGLSRLKTHRIVVRLAERGIVSLEKTGNTNQVFLANWLKQP